MAQNIVKATAPGSYVGKNWVSRFLQRHPEVKIKRSSKLEKTRVRGSTRETFERFFDLLERQVKAYNIKVANIANIDEHGIQESESRSRKVLGTSLTNRAYLTTSDVTTWVSIIEYGTTEGIRLTPLIIFTGTSLQGQ
jgi:4-hydroxybenzoate polyprenyltransferase